jgi:hypothetical protein
MSSESSLKRIAFIALAVSAITFSVDVYITSDWNRTPIMLPLPGPGLEVAAPFTVTTGGNFRLEAQVPSKPEAQVSGDMRALPPIRCKFNIFLEGLDGFKSQSVIEELTHSGEIQSEKMSLFSSGGLTVPQGGGYSFRLANLGCGDPLQFRGGMVMLTRYDRPTERYLGAQLSRAIGWLTLIIGIICAVWSELVLVDKKR